MDLILLWTHKSMPWCCLNSTFLPAACSHLAFLQCPLPPLVFYAVSVPSPTFSSTQILYLSLCAALAKNPPASSISPSPLAFSREVIHGIALPQANSSTKIPWEHGGMAGVSRAGRAAARSHSQAAGKRKKRIAGGLPAPGVATAMFTPFCRVLLSRFLGVGKSCQ